MKSKLCPSIGGMVIHLFNLKTGTIGGKGCRWSQRAWSVATMAEVYEENQGNQWVDMEVRVN